MDISIVIPLFNEDESLPELAAWIERVMAANHYSYEVIMIDDGSSDNSWNIIEGIMKGLLTFKIFPDSKIAANIMQFMPLESMSNLIVEPFTRLSVIKNLETAIGGAGDTKDYGVHFTAILIVLVWTVIFMLMSYKLLKKRDL